MTPTEIDEEKAIALEEPKDLELNRNVLRPVPSIIAAIVSTTLSILEETPGESDIETLYISTKQFVQSISNRDGNQNLLESVFVYYIEAFRTLQAVKISPEGKPILGGSPIHQILYNNAAISIFDLYLLRPTDGMIRRMLPLALSSLHEVIAVQQSSVDDRPMKEILSELSTIALLSQTVNEYIKGYRRRKNFGYVQWLKDLFIKLLENRDISFLKNDPIVKMVLTQVTNRKLEITIPVPKVETD